MWRGLVSCVLLFLLLSASACDSAVDEPTPKTTSCDQGSCVEVFVDVEDGLLAKLQGDGKTLLIVGTRADAQQLHVRSLHLLDAQGALEAIFYMDETGMRLRWVLPFEGGEPAAQGLHVGYEEGGEVVVSRVSFARETGTVTVLERVVGYPELMEPALMLLSDQHALNATSAGTTALKSNFKLVLAVVTVTAVLLTAPSAGLLGIAIGLLAKGSDAKAAVLEPGQPMLDPSLTPELELPLLPAACALPVAPPHGSVRLTGAEDGDLATFDCDREYNKVGASLAMCRDGVWSDEPPICVPNDCLSTDERLTRRFDGEVKGYVHSPFWFNGAAIAVEGDFSFQLRPRQDDGIADIESGRAFVSSEHMALEMTVQGFATCTRVYGYLTSDISGIPFRAEFSGDLRDDGSASGTWWGKDQVDGRQGRGQGRWSQP